MSGRQRVVILGGGLAGLTAAYELSKTAALRERYELTLYQMGWRLGGKAASGRGHAQRVEEHGLHLFFGFYANAFSLVRGVYDELDGPGNLPGWQAAFVPQHSLDLWHRHGGELRRWSVQFPATDELPGDAHPHWELAALLERAVSFALSLAARALGLPPARAAKLGERLQALELRGVEEVLRRLWRELERGEAGDPREQVAIVGALRESSRAFVRHLGRLADRHYGVYQAFVAVDWVLAVLRGALRDGLAQPGGWRRIDHLDYRAWLHAHGADRRTLDSALVRAYYSAVLAVPGDRHIPVAAGTALRTQLRMFLTYRGAFLNKIRAGLGDSVIAPLYKVLRQRGVDVQLFHRVLDLVPEGREVRSVQLRRQARAKGGARYEPLIRVGELDAWPGEPLWEQLEGGRETSARRFEHELGVPASERERGDVVELRAGRDYDAIVFALPLATIPKAAPSLLAASSRWQAAVREVRDIATQSVQLWLRDTPASAGWTGQPAFSTTHVPPLDTWADVSFVLEHEAWPAHARPKGLLYFTGFLDDAPTADSPEAVAEVRARAHETLRRYAEEVAPALFPRELRLHRAQGFDSALASQFVTANIEPWERYVLACPGTNQHRLAADDCGFDNLTVAGDWTANDIYSGCAEGAVVSGMLAARALGAELEIEGEGTW